MSKDSGAIEEGKGGSMILTRAAQPRGTGDSADARNSQNGHEGGPDSPQGEKEDNDDDMGIGKGGSMIFGIANPEVGGKRWEIGEPIKRPKVLKQCQRTYVDSGKGKFIRVSYSYATLQGFSSRPPQKPNQDSLVVCDHVGSREDLALFAAFDGHGPAGEVASNFCRVHLEDVMTSSKRFTRDPIAALARSFPKLHKKIRDVPAPASVDRTFSGTTAVAVMLHKQRLVCANVGDSRAVLCSKDGDREGYVLARPLSVDHKPSRPDEKSRIEAAPNSIIHSEVTILRKGDREKLYVCRKKGNSIQYAILFTRSVGDQDAHENLGVLADAEVRSIDLDESRDIFFIVASDGVWDHVSNERACAIVRDCGNDPHKGSEAIMERARRGWETGGSGRRDDITVIVGKLDWMSEEQASEEQRLGRPLDTHEQGSGAGATSAGTDGGFDVGERERDGDGDSRESKQSAGAASAGASGKKVVGGGSTTTKFVGKDDAAPQAKDLQLDDAGSVEDYATLMAARGLKPAGGAAGPGLPGGVGSPK